MKRVLLGGLVGGAIVVTACSGGSPSSDCNNFVSVLCQKLFQCAATAAATLYGNEAACETKVSQQYNCSAFACPSNTTYHGAQFEQCTSEINAESCANAQNTPSSCQGITTQSVCY